MLSRNTYKTGYCLLLWLILLQSQVLLAANDTTNIASSNEAVLSLTTAREEALRNNAAVAAMRADAQAMAQMPAQAGALPDPQLSLNAMNIPTDTYDLDQEAMTQMQVGISQRFPFPGKRGLRSEAAEHQAQAALQEAEETRQQVLRNVTHNWWQLAYLDRSLEIIKRNQLLLRQFVQIAQTKYKVGKGLQQDVLLAQVELSKLIDSALQLKAMRRHVEAELNALLNRPVLQAIHLPQTVDDKLLELPQEALLQQQALGQRARLAALNSQLESARSRVALAKKDRLPDFRLGANYGKRQGNNPDGSDRSDFASLMFSMNLPIYAARKQNKAITQRAAEMDRQQHLLQQVSELIGREISGAYADYQRAREQAMLFKQGIIPQARQTVASMLSGYQVNKVDFLNLVRAQITLYNFETQYWKAVTEANQARARLAAAVGQESL